MCKACGVRAGYLLIRINGKIGSYYEQKCKNCGKLYRSEAMHACNNSWYNKVGTFSFSSVYTFAEEYVRYVLREGNS